MYTLRYDPPSRLLSNEQAEGEEAETPTRFKAERHGTRLRLGLGRAPAAMDEGSPVVCNVWRQRRRRSPHCAGERVA